MSVTCPPVEKAQNIAVRRVKVHSPSQLPTDYGTTPGGTLFGTTPGGTKIIYDRAFLLECRNSPLVKSPLAELPRIPGVTCPKERNSGSPPVGSPKVSAGIPNGPAAAHQGSPTKVDKPPASSDDPQFDIDM